MFSSYVLNAPSSIYVVWSIVKGFLEESTIKKFSIYKDNYPLQLLTNMDLKYLEKKYGG